MKLVIPRFDFFNLERSFKKDLTYLFPDFLVEHITKDSISRTGYLPFNSIIDLKYFLLPYDYERDKNFKPYIIMVRTGGYGDVIALSSVIQYFFDNDLCDNFIFITEKEDIVKYFKAYKNLYNKRFFVGNIGTPLNKFPFLYKNGELDQEKIRYIIFEGIIENDKKHNWYDLFFKVLNIDYNIIDDIYKRPFLVFNERDNPDILLSYKPKNKKTILLTLSSTSYVRSFPYYNLIKTLIDNNYFVIIFDGHLTRYDKEKIKQLLLYEPNNRKYRENLFIIPFELTFNEYLNIIYYVDLTITVDTMTTHFREGLNKSSINIYISFPSWARSKYYQYNTDIYLKSSCPYQPCFIHTKRKDEKCKYYKILLNNYNKNKLNFNIKKYLEKIRYFPPCVIDLENEIITKIYKLVYVPSASCLIPSGSCPVGE